MNVTGTGSVHGERSVVKRKGGILARTHRHPVPLRGIRGGADAGHSHVNVLERQRLTPKSNALVGEVQRELALAIDGEVLAQI